MNIVSGFISNINKRSDRDVTKYINYGLELMSVEIPMTIFIERELFDVSVLPVLQKRGISPAAGEGTFTYRVSGGVMDGLQQTFTYVKMGHIVFIFFRICDLFLWPYKKMANKFTLNTNNLNKDTLEYMMVQCQKSEWMAIASQYIRSTSQQNNIEYVWIDFGVFHMFQGKIDVFQTELYKMKARVHKRLTGGSSKRVLFARCWDPNHAYYGDIYKDINWLFAGSVFGGGELVINQFALKMREKCLQIMRERNTLMWEVNIWVLIYRELPDLFAFYPSDHSEIVFRGYS